MCISIFPRSVACFSKRRDISISFCNKNYHPFHLKEQYQSTPYEKQKKNFESNTIATNKSEPNMTGSDLWRQLKQVSIPVFSGDKHGSMTISGGRKAGISENSRYKDHL